MKGVGRRGAWGEVQRVQSVGVSVLQSWGTPPSRDVDVFTDPEAPRIP